MPFYVISCQYGMARHQVTEGDGLQIWMVAANMLKKVW
jgi:hypothetical protein